MYFRRRIENDLAPGSVGTFQTRFFNAPEHLSLLSFMEQHLFPEWEAEAASGSRARRIRIWTSRSVDKEVSYSLAMTLLGRFPARSGWRIHVLETGLSTPAHGDNSPVETSKGVGSRDEMQAGSEIASVIEVRRVNLNDDAYPLGGPFDLILSKNVLTCFTYQTKLDAARALGRLSPARHRSKTRTR